MLSNIHPDSQYSIVKEKREAQWDTYRRRITKAKCIDREDLSQEVTWQFIRDTVCDFVLNKEQFIFLGDMELSERRKERDDPPTGKIEYFPRLNSYPFH